MTEKEIVTAIIKYLKTLPGVFAWKEHGGMYGTAGLPDIIACVGGRFYAFEVKTEKGRLTRLQDATIRKIKDAGGMAFTVTGASQVKDIIQTEEVRK